jgi:hypothetical protein
VGRARPSLSRLGGQPQLVPVAGPRASFPTGPCQLHVVSRSKMSRDGRRHSERTFRMGRLFLANLLVAMSVAAALATQGSHAASSTSTLGATPVPVQFPANGWDVRRNRVHACPGVLASRCSQVTSLASTTRWRDCVECLPHKTFAAMPRSGIAIQITVAVEHPVRAVHTFSWPPQVKRAQVQAGFEGLPSRIGVYQAASLIRKREVSLFVWFGRSRPTVSQVSRANAELRHARLG